mmetsp:Transcript_32134/g.49118  ORF Transcript_32134/g.49118 Transcript_32134/m.49118 type:complete len:142 (-) Transcript_32134:74-499(-)|eukprot:CAMPEP_0118701418 /NCGR_PEP_ID=MMETSP0800-20121206/17241_1 /TAXON_ID=210618 ORGANISM="Striatella unipunctata, Strain CCMP2910" /NCGR_SAMPLE_ID=MMETSP0800 /ASSEMBLY_ACC=CAM_ASM_000638 /LENGTH=141 /DNA_ID=CAMNT_0006602339 /DNA_START=113 /DNA_END=538 /DNA_ORIENTATION=+
MFSSPFDQALSKPFLDQEETRSNREEPQLQNSFYRPPVQQYNDEEGLVRERHSDVAHIARSMAQIHDIQQDLAVLVESQQVDIDSVERHALETYDQAERGVVHLEQAAQYSKKQFGLSKSGLGASILLICIFMTTMYFALH